MAWYDVIVALLCVFYTIKDKFQVCYSLKILFWIFCFILVGYLMYSKVDFLSLLHVLYQKAENIYLAKPKKRSS